MNRTPSGWYHRQIGDFGASVRGSKPGVIQIAEPGKPVKILTRSELYEILNFSEQVESAERQTEEKPKPETFVGIGGNYI